MGNFKNNEFKVHILCWFALIFSVFLFAFSALFMVAGIRAEAADEPNRSSYIGGVPNKEKYGTYGTNEYYTFYGSETTSAVMTHHGDFEDAKYDNNHRWYRRIMATSYAGSTYIKYPLAVKYRDKRYDLVIYPWLEGGTGRGGFLYYNDQFKWNEPDKRGFIGYKTPCMYIRGGELRFTMFVCEPPKNAMATKSKLDSFVGEHVDWTGWFGINDLDNGEYVIIPNAGISEFANGFGSELTKEIITQSETKYVGKGSGDNDNNPSAWSSRAIYGKFNIPSSGLTIAYGGKGSTDWTTNIDFSQFKGTIPDVEYRIHFDGNGGSPVPSDLILVNDSVGSIGATVPVRSGYAFMGWSSTKDLQPGDKRLFADDTAAGWDVDQYLAKTGGTLEEYKPADADRTTYMVLNLYAQWEPCVAVSVTNKSAVYTGNSITAPNGVTVTKPASGYTIKYRKSGETSYSTTRPSWVNAGSYTVEYQVTAEGYTTKTGSYSFTIDRAPIDAPVSIPLTYTGGEQTGVMPGKGYIITGNTGTVVQYYLALATPNSNHKWSNGSDVTGSRAIPWSIERATIGVPQPFNPTYTGKVQTGVPAGTGYTITDNTGTDAGNYTAHATPDSNHRWNSGSDVTAVRDIPWSIARADIVAAAADQSEVYTGSTITAPNGVSVTKPVTGYTIKYRKSGETAYSTTRPSWTNAGSYTVEYEITAGNNYNQKTGSYTFTIYRAPIEVPAAVSEVLIYNGEEQTGVPTGPGYTITGNTGMDAGGYIAHATPDSNHKWNYGSDVTGTFDIPWSIERAPVEVPAAVSLTYTGKAQTGVPAGSGYTITDNTGTDAGNYTAHATPDSNHKWNSGSDVTGKRDIPWSIARADIEAAAADQSEVYTGSAIAAPNGVTVTKPVTGYTIKYRKSGETAYSTTRPSWTDAGNYTVEYEITAGNNYNQKTGSYTFTIDRAPIEVPAPVSEVLIYNGGEQTGVPAGSGYTITDNTGTDAGNYTAHATPDSNHKWNSGSGVTGKRDLPWSIDRAPIEVPAAVSEVLIYNGDEQTGVPAGTGYTITDNTGTDAGNYTAHATPDSNHKWNSGHAAIGKRDILWSIERADIEAASRDTSAVYTGSAIASPNGVSVTKPVTGYTIKYRKSGETAYSTTRPFWTDAGNYTVEYEITAGNNYNQKTGSYTFTIDRASIEVPAAVSEVLIYNGEEQTGVPAGSGYTITDNTGTDAGNYIAHATPDSNHKWNGESDVTAVRDIPWSIGKAPGSITPAISEDRATFPEPSVFSFDHTGDGLISAYSDDEEVAVLTLDGNTVTVTPVNTGECNINIVIAEGGNYSASSATVKMVVEPGKIRVNAPDEVGYYTGSDISPDGITVEIPVSGATVRYSNGTMRKTGPVTYTMAVPPVIRYAGTHTVYYTVSAKNYATESGTFEVIINNANISVEVPHRSVVYNGKPQKPDGIKVIDPETGAEVLYGEAPGSYTLDSPPSFTDAGEHMIYYRGTAEDYNERTGSYAYEIMRKPVAVPSAIPGLVYDGTEKTGVREGEGFTLTGNRKTEAGTYKAFASLIKNYIWNDGSTEDKEIEWTIEEEKAPDIPDPGIKVTGVYLNRDYLELTTGVPGIITVRTEPSDAVPEGFTWTVDEPEVLSLGTVGLPGTFDRDLSRTVKAQKMGVYTVTITETRSGLSASCKVRGLAYYDFAKEGYLVTSTAEHEVRKIKGKFYCFDSQGRAEAGFITVNDSAYYFDPDTGVAVKGYQEIKGGRYFFDRKSCVMVRDGMMKFKGKTYHFGTDGKASGGVYYLPDRKDSRAWFYFDENAVMQSGVFRVSLSGNALSGGGSGVPENSVAEDSSGDGLLYFFKKGKLLTPAKDGVFSVNRKKYYVYTDGHVAEGRVTVRSGKGDLIYEPDSDGSLLNGTKVNEEGLLYLYKNGVQVKAPKKPAKGGEGVWKTVNRKRYLLKYEDGGLSSNVCFVGNYEDPKAGRLYLKEDGSMAAGELVRVTLGEMQEVMNAGADLPDVEDDESLWLYYNRKGKLVTREMTKDGWYKVGKQSAYIYEAGNAASGWAVIDGRTYWFDPHTGLTNITVGYVRI